MNPATPDPSPAVDSVPNPAEVEDDKSAPARPHGYGYQVAALSLLGVVLAVGAVVGLLVATGVLAPKLPAPVAVEPGSFPPGFAYADADGVWALSDDGRQRARLVQPPRGAVLKGPTWEPGARRIVYAATRPYQRNANNGTDLRVVGWDGGDDRVLVDHGDADHHLEWPAFSADGRYLYFGHSYPVFQGGAYKGESADVERLDTATGERRVLIEGASQPSVSADGSRLAFMRVYSSGAAQLWTAAADGSGARPAIAGDQEFAYAYSPRLSPDGRTVAVSATGGLAGRRTAAPRPAALAWLFDWFDPPVATAHGGGPWELWLVPVETGVPVRLLSASSQSDEMSLSWSPDGARVVYLTRGALGTVEVATDRHVLLCDDVGLGDIAWPK